MGSKIICIGRQFGSGGHEIAVKTGERLGIKVYEKNILHLACKYGDLAVSTMEGADEKATNPYLFQTIHEGNYHVARGLPTSEVLFQLQSHEIRRIARRESCIFVGRCADFVLADEDLTLLRVFICAPFDYRVERKAEQENLPLSNARRLVKKMDKQRAAYYETYTGRSWGSCDNYDLCFDTSRSKIDDIVCELASVYLDRL